jgi:hypothetical protein
MKKLLVLVTVVLGIVLLVGIKVQPWSAENMDGVVSHYTSVELYDFAKCNFGPVNTMCEIDWSESNIWSINF